MIIANKFRLLVKQELSTVKWSYSNTVIKRAICFVVWYLIYMNILTTMPVLKKKKFMIQSERNINVKRESTRSQYLVLTSLCPQYHRRDHSIVGGMKLRGSITPIQLLQPLNTFPYLQQTSGLLLERIYRTKG